MSVGADCGNLGHIARTYIQKGGIVSSTSVAAANLENNHFLSSSDFCQDPMVINNHLYHFNIKWKILDI